MRHVRRLVRPALALTLLLLAPHTTQAQVLPAGLAESFESAVEPGDLIAASTPDGHVLLGSARLALTPGQTSFRASIFNPDDALSATIELSPTLLFPPAERFAAAGRANNDFLIVFERRLGGSSEIVARQYRNDGTAVGDEQILAPASNTLVFARPRVACNRVGRCAVAWVTFGLPNHRSVIEGLIFDTLSPPPQDHFVVEPDPGNSIGAYTLALSDDGRVGVAFNDEREVTPPLSTPFVIVRPRTRVFDALGNPLGLLTLDPGLSSNVTDAPKLRLGAAFNTAGELLVLWSQQVGGGQFPRIRAQRLDLFGQLSGPVRSIDDGLESASGPALVWDADAERFAAVWFSARTDADSGALVQTNTLRLLAPDGTPIGEELAATTQVLQHFGRFLSPPSPAIGAGSSVHLGWLSKPANVASPSTFHERIVFRDGPPSCDPIQPGGRQTCADIGPAGRFRMSAAYRVQELFASSRPATFEAITPNAAFLFFQGQQNPEVVAKVLDGRTINEHLWYFSGAMSDQEYAVSVFDQETGRSKVYFNPGSFLRSLADTGTFNDDELAANVEAVGAGFNPAQRLAPELLARGEAIGPDFTRAALNAAPTVSTRGAGCNAATATSLCLNQSRFRVEITFRDLAGNLSLAHAVQTTTDGGYFTFFNPNNVEVALKILDGTAINGKFWVFYASLSNVRFTVRIFDTNGALIKSYVNPRDTFQSVADTGAF